MCYDESDNPIYDQNRVNSKASAGKHRKAGSLPQIWPNDPRPIKCPMCMYQGDSKVNRELTDSGLCQVLVLMMMCLWCVVWMINRKMDS